MDPGEQTTGTRDEQYNLIAVLYHALHGSENAEIYAVDAEAAGDERLASFFREAQEAQRGLAERAKGMLGILEVPPEPGVRPEGAVPSDTGPGSVPPEGGVSPGAMSGGVPPEPAGAPTGRAAPPPETDVPPETPPGDVPPGSAGIQRETGLRGDEADATAGETAPTTDIPRTPSDTARPGPEVPPGAPSQAPPADVERSTGPERPPQDAPPAGVADATEPTGAPPDVPPPHIPVASPQEGETPGEPGRATAGQGAAGQTEREGEPEREREEDKGLIDKAIDKLMGRDEERRREGPDRGEGR